MEHSSYLSSSNREPLILIVDDIPRNLQVLGSILGENGYSVNVASNGKGALDSVAAQMPDLILLDVQMPDIDGIEVCKQLQSDPQTAHIPVIFLTARTDTEDIVRGFEAGAVDYITKPFFFAELLARVRTHLKIKQYSDIITEQNQHLQAFDQEREEFLGIIAHDLKNPLSNIHLLAELLERKRADITPAQLKTYADDLNLATDRMVCLIDNLLNLHALDTGNFTFSVEPVDVVPIVVNIVEEYRLHANNKHITLAVNAPATAIAQTDHTAFTQVLDNLVSNAIKYSPDGAEVNVTVSALPSAVSIAVQDKGAGIASEEQSLLFTKFVRLSTKPTGGESSTGLGLSIVKRLTEAMDGTVRCESTVGKGSIFTIEFPSNQ